MIVAVLLAGGSGTRLWPMSRGLFPKQFLKLAGDQTMLQATVERGAALPDVQPPVVICGEDHRFIVAEQLQQTGETEATIVLEPVGRNTAPAAAVAARCWMNASCANFIAGCSEKCGTGRASSAARRRTSASTRSS